MPRCYVALEQLTLIHTGVVGIALLNFEEILLKTAEVKFAWTNYVIHKN
jgi:hypothetical protein